MGLRKIFSQRYYILFLFYYYYYYYYLIYNKNYPKFLEKGSQIKTFAKLLLWYQNCFMPLSILFNFWKKNYPEVL